ncbi:MAG TPA: hypothetical protein PLG43_00225 [Spirochaetia bacterium]|nr:hypothetical protein [Spirochaetia bacterium]
MPEDDEQFTFHYNREERLARLPASAKKSCDTPRRKKRLSFFIIVLDVVILALIVAYASPRLFKSGEGTLGAYTFKLSGYVYDGKPLVSLTIKLREDSAPEESGEVQVTFSVPGKGGETTIFHFLPVTTEEPVVVRTSLSAGSPGDELIASCKTEAGGITLKVRLKGEQD